METILIINDNSPEAAHAAELALALAQKRRTNVLLANTAGVNNTVVKKVLAGAVAGNSSDGLSISDLHTRLLLLNNSQFLFRPNIEEFDISTMDETKVAELINKNQIWMMVKGMVDVLPGESQKTRLNIHTVLNKVLCPLLLVPKNWSLKHIVHLAYIADLRYCRIQIVRYLAVLAKPWQAALSIAHVTAKGLPDMAEKYAQSLFDEGICSHVNYDQVFFNNIKERDLTTIVDVLINGMHNDILVLVNRQFHFEEILGRYITGVLPPAITVPLLIFPY